MPVSATAIRACAVVLMLFAAGATPGLAPAAAAAAEDSPERSSTARLADVVAKRPEGPTVEVPTLRFAVAEAIGRAFTACAVRKEKPRTIHVLDLFGNTVYAARMDGQFADNIEVARMKAAAALYFRENTGVWLERSRHDPQLAQLLAQMGQFISPTGFPIIVEGQVLGSVGVGGASGDCAYEALTEVLGPQPPWTRYTD